jgi:NurA-like 5'-3' nuclease
MQSDSFQYDFMSLQSLNSLDDQPKKLRMGSISSIRSELYHQYHMHINVMKWTGVIVLLGLTTSTLGVSSNLFHMEKSYICKCLLHPYTQTYTEKYFYTKHLSDHLLQTNIRHTSAHPTTWFLLST